MRRLTWFLMLAFVFAIPWAYSLNLGDGIGDIARVLGLLVLLCAIPTVLQAGQLRTPTLVHALTLAVFLWFCLTVFWSVDTTVTLTRVRGYFQELMIIWLLWEFAADERDLRAVLRAWLAGSWVLAALTIASFAVAHVNSADQIRFSAFGQDPNDVARYIDLVFPLAALLALEEGKWPWRLLALGYFPIGLTAVVLTASRGGALVAVLALAGAALLFASRRPRLLAAGLIVFSVCFALFALNVMGGGDAKLLTASAVWFGITFSLVEFLIYVSFLGGILTFAILSLRSHTNAILASGLPVPGHILSAKKVPYGIAIGIAAFMAYPSSPLMLAALGG